MMAVAAQIQLTCVLARDFGLSAALPKYADFDIRNRLSAFQNQL